MSCLDCIPPHLGRIDSLFTEINTHIPEGSRGVSVLRADIAGMYVVTIAAMYENCVKDVMVTYASRHHEKFEYFANKTYSKLSSRVRIKDLNTYCKSFSSEVHEKFKSELKSRKDRIRQYTGKNIETAFDQLLDWRHDFAHAGLRNTTIEEALATHKLARHVIFSFAGAFDKSE